MSLPSLFSACLICLLCWSATPSGATEYWVSPDQTENGDGSQTAPWNTLEAALRSGTLKGGDRLVLEAGEYGSVTLRNLRFGAEAPLEIVAEAPGAAHMLGLNVVGSSGLVIRDLAIWPVNPVSGTYDRVFVGRHSPDIVFHGLDVRGRPDAPETYLSWSKDEWLGPWRSNGMKILGPRNAVYDSTFTGVGFGITASGKEARVIGNEVRGFSGDGLRGLGNNAVFRGNLVRDCVKIDDNHDDGFQSWAKHKDANGVPAVSGTIIEANRILEWTGPEDHPLRCRLQGIGMFDGMYRNWVIRNNVVSVSVYHGISVYGAEGVQIINNSVVNARGLAGGKPWIMISDHKNGTPARDNLVVNNLSNSFKTKVSAGGDVIPTSMNVVVRYPYRTYLDPVRFDYRLRDDSPLIDVGVAEFAPPEDIEGRPRPLGAGPDMGAHEMR